MRAAKAFLPVLLSRNSLTSSPSQPTPSSRRALCRLTSHPLQRRLPSSISSTEFLPTRSNFSTEVDQQQPEISTRFETSGSVTATALKTSLDSEKIKHSDGHACYRSTCPVCGTSHKTAESALINKNTGKWLCEVCQSKGSWSSYLSLRKSTRNQLRLLNHEADQKRREESDKLAALLEEGTKISESSPAAVNALLKSVKLDGITQKTLSALDCRFDEGKGTLMFPVKNADGTFASVRVLVADKNKPGQFTEKVYPTGSVVPFGADRSASEISGSMFLLSYTQTHLLISCSKAKSREQVIYESMIFLRRASVLNSSKLFESVV